MEIVIRSIKRNLPADVFEKELNFAGRAASKRIKEFVFGRSCAHNAIIRIKSISYLLMTNGSKIINWPIGCSGSISHSQNIAISIILKKIISINCAGIDIERLCRMNLQIWHRVFSFSEICWLNTQSHKYRDTFALIIFSAKECFYKYQFSITKKYVSLVDIKVLVDKKKYKFEIQFNSFRYIASFAPRRKTGLYAYISSHVVTTIC